MNASDEAPQGGGRFRADPAPALRPFVVEYWAMARDLAAMGGFTITPDGFGELICCEGDVFVVAEGRRDPLPPCFLIGLLDRPLRIEAAGVIRCMAARLRPWAIGRMPACDLSQPWADAGHVFGPRLHGVLGLVGRCDWPPLVAIFDEVLLAETRDWGPVLAGIDLAGPFVGPSPPCTGEVASGRGITGRQVERRVRELTRMSPKQLACLARFQKARDAIWADPQVDLARLAVEVGFSDQPHMTRQFRRFSGQTPARFARDAASRKTGLAARDVAFVQDRGLGGG